MTPQDLSDLHARCFVTPRPWGVAEFKSLLSSPHVFLKTTRAGFILGRVIADEAEILTLAVAPENRRAGQASELLKAYESEALERNGEFSFLEVSADNDAAILLYKKFGYIQTGCRPKYYHSPDGKDQDALIFSRNLT